MEYIVFKVGDIMEGYITCLFMFRPLYIEIYYLCGVASRLVHPFPECECFFIPSL